MNSNYMRPKEAAEYLQVSTSVLAKFRMKNRLTEGPRFSKIGGSVVYLKTDLDDWFESAASRPPQ